MGVPCKFQTMHNNLRAERATTHHNKMLLELLVNSTSVNKPAGKTPKDERVVNVDKIKEKPPKKTRQANPDNWHLKLKVAIEGPLKKAGNLSFTKIINFCGKDAYSVVAKGLGVCAPNLFFRVCFNGEKCTKKHKPATEEQLKKVLDLTDKFIKDLSKLKIG